MELTKYDNIFLSLSNDEAGDLLHAIINYNYNKDYCYKYLAVKTIFNHIIKPDIDKRQKISNIRSMAGVKGMKKRYNK